MNTFSETTVDSIVKAFQELILPVSGNLKTKVSGPCAPETPVAGAICFTSNPEHLLGLFQSRVSAVGVHPKMASLVKDAPAHIVILTTKNTKLAMTLVNQKFFPMPCLGEPFDSHQRIHSTATISKTAKVAADAIIGPHAVISAGVVIGAGVNIGAQTFIGQNTIIGDHTRLHPLVYIAHNCKIGARCEIKSNSTIGSYGFGFARDDKGLNHHVPHYGGAILEDDIHIGANTTVDGGTFAPSHLGAGTKIDNHCHIGHNATIGKNVIITAGFIMAGSATIGDNCVFGGTVSVNGHISIASNTSIAPLSGVSNNITVPGVYGGYPPMPFKDHLKAQTSLQHLPRMRRAITRIVNHLGLKESES